MIQLQQCPSVGQRIVNASPSLLRFTVIPRNKIHACYLRHAFTSGEIPICFALLYDEVICFDINLFSKASAPAVPL